MKRLFLVATPLVYAVVDNIAQKPCGAIRDRGHVPVEPMS